MVREAVQKELDQRKLATVAIQGQKVYLDASIAYLKNESLSPPARAFLETLDDLCEGRCPIKGIRSLLSKHEMTLRKIQQQAYEFTNFGIG